MNNKFFMMLRMVLLSVFLLFPSAHTAAAGSSGADAVPVASIDNTSTTDSHDTENGDQVEMTPAPTKGYVVFEDELPYTGLILGCILILLIVLGRIGFSYWSRKR